MKPIKLPKYSKPQALEDWRPYRLSDLFAFFDVPEQEQEAFRWSLDNSKSIDWEKIGREWWVPFIRFQSIYRSLRLNGDLDLTQEQLRSKYGKA